MESAAVVANALDGARLPPFDAPLRAFGAQHLDDLLGAAVAEELAEGFLVVGDAVFFDEGDEIGGSVAGEGGFSEMRIFGEEVFRLGVEIREVAATAAGDENFLADFFGSFEEHDAAAAFTSFDGTEETGGAGAEDDYVKVVHPGSFE